MVCLYVFLLGHPCLFRTLGLLSLGVGNLHFPLACCFGCEVGLSDLLGVSICVLLVAFAFTWLA